MVAVDRGRFFVIELFGGSASVTDGDLGLTMSTVGVTHMAVPFSS